MTQNDKRVTARVRNGAAWGAHGTMGLQKEMAQMKPIGMRCVVERDSRLEKDYDSPH